MLKIVIWSWPMVDSIRNLRFPFLYKKYRQKPLHPWGTCWFCSYCRWESTCVLLAFPVYPANISATIPEAPNLCHVLQRSALPLVSDLSCHWQGYIIWPFSLCLAIWLWNLLQESLWSGNCSNSTTFQVNHSWMMMFTVTRTVLNSPRGVTISLRVMWVLKCDLPKIMHKLLFDIYFSIYVQFFPMLPIKPLLSLSPCLLLNGYLLWFSHLFINLQPLRK